MKHSLKLAFAGLLALGAAGVSTASSAMPVAPPAQTQLASPLEEIGWRCGPRAHVNRWGRCVPNRRAYYRPYRPYRPYRHWRRW